MGVKDRVFRSGEAGGPGGFVSPGTDATGDVDASGEVDDTGDVDASGEVDAPGAPAKRQPTSRRATRNSDKCFIGAGYRATP
jgi:hypothetical protein